MINVNWTEVVDSIHKIVAMMFGFIANILLYFVPVQGLVEALGIAFIVNIALGIYHSVRYESEGLSLIKFFSGLKELTIYILILAGLWVIGDKMKAADFVYQFAAVITWGLLYLYATNIFRNLHRVFPNSKGLRWIFYMFNLEFLRINPGMKDFLDKENEQNESDE